MCIVFLQFHLIMFLVDRISYSRMLNTREDLNSWGGVETFSKTNKLGGLINWGNLPDRKPAML